MGRPNLSKWLHIVEQALPFVLMSAAPQYQMLGGAIVAGMREAEQIPGASGPEKLAHARSIALAAAQGYNGAMQKEVVNLNEFAQVADVLISNTVSIANTIHSLPGAIQNVKLDAPPPVGAPTGAPPVSGPALTESSDGGHPLDD